MTEELREKNKKEASRLKIKTEELKETLASGDSRLVSFRQATAPTELEHWPSTLQSEQAAAPKAAYSFDTLLRYCAALTSPSPSSFQTFPLSTPLSLLPP